MGNSGSGSGSTAGQTGTSGSGSVGSSGSGSGSTYGQNGSSGSGSTYGQNGSSGSGSTGVSGSMGTSGSMGSASGSASADTTGGSASLRTVSGAVAKVAQDSITLDQAAGGVTLTVDSQTKVWRNGKQASGITSIREGEQVRASFDPASNRADKIEIVGKHHKAMKMHKDPNPAAGTDSAATPPPAPDAK